MSATTELAEPAMANDPGPGAGLPRLLAGLDMGGRPMPLAAHRRLYPAPPAPGRRRVELVAAAEAAGLRGRGGAGFPTARKLKAVASGRHPIVVVNGTEGEPASAKDKVLMQLAPHLVLDGAMLAAAAVGADEVIVGVDRHATGAQRALHQALAERAGEPASRSIAVRVESVPHGYVAGEESALVHWLNGGPAVPTLTPPRPSERGVARRPTLVDNVETLAHLAQIARFGPEWFRRVGTPSEPGSALVTLSGGLARPGVCEVRFGARLSDVVAAGETDPGRIGAVLVGGFYGSWLSPIQVSRLRLCDEDLRPVGGGVGCGAVVVLPPEVCGLRETARILTWLAGETAGQCGPCVNGLPAIAGAITQLSQGYDTVALLRRWAGQVEGRGACRFPDGAVRLLRSALDVFADDITRHRHGSGCPPQPGYLAVPDTGSRQWR